MFSVFGLAQKPSFAIATAEQWINFESVAHKALTILLRLSVSYFAQHVFIAQYKNMSCVLRLVNSASKTKPKLNRNKSDNREKYEDHEKTTDRFKVMICISQLTIKPFVNIW